MENKYYTPEIEEFCVGFEYESYEVYRNLADEWDEGKPMWVKRKVLDINQEMYSGESHKYKAIYHVSINNRYEQNVEWNKNIRVKFLDREDIESLGFVFYSTMESKLLNTEGNIYYNKDLNLVLSHYPTLNKVSTITRDPSLNKFLLKGVWDDKQVNLITIKNKTELIKLLKQLEIYE